MNLLRIALLAAGAYLLLRKLGFSLPALPGAQPAPASVPPQTTGAGTDAAAIDTAAAVILKERVRARAAQDGPGPFNWWQWTWFYHNVLNGNTAELIPPSQAYGLPGETLLSFEEFWQILQNGKAAGIGAILPGLSGLPRRAA